LQNLHHTKILPKLARISHPKPEAHDPNPSQKRQRKQQAGAIEKAWQATWSDSWESGAAAHLLHEVGVHNDEQAEERDGAGEVEVLEREADPPGEQLGQHPRQARVHPQERLLRIHPPAAPRRPPPNPKQGRAPLHLRLRLHLPLPLEGRKLRFDWD